MSTRAEVHFPIRQQGFRTKEIIVVTTLLDAKTYTKAQLAKLYQLRWEVEVDLLIVKTTLGMDELRGKTPQMVRKEIYVHLIAYNLLRTLMWEAGIAPWVYLHCACRCKVPVSISTTLFHS